MPFLFGPLKIRFANHSVGGGAAVLPSPGLNWPDATNTGTAGSLAVLSGDITTTGDNQIITGKNITGSLTIAHNNVTVFNCKVTGTGLFAIAVIDGLTTAPTIYNCELIGSALEGCNGIQGYGTIYNNNIYNCENGINVTDSMTFHDNYIHDLFANGSPHYDGIQMDGSLQNITITHNHIINPNSQTSAVMIDNFAGAANNIVVNNNLLVGGSYCAFSDSSFNATLLTNIVYTNNLLTIISGGFGYFDFNGNTPTAHDNQDATTLAYIDGALPAQNFSTIFIPTAAMTAEDYNPNLTFRHVATLASVPVSPTQIRFLMKAGINHPLTVSNCAWGKSNGTAAQAVSLTEATYRNGGSGFTITENQSVFTDWMNLGSTTLNTGDQIVFTTRTVTTGAGTTFGSLNTNVTAYFDDSGNNTWNQVNPSGLTPSSGNCFGLQRIEMR